MATRKQRTRKATTHKTSVPASIKKHITAIGKHADALRKHTTKKH